MSKETVTFEIEESPYGDTGATYTGMLGMFNHFLLQLKSFRTLDKTEEERSYLEADIRGYEEVLASGSEENAHIFMKTKHQLSDAGTPAENNEVVVAKMKEMGTWHGNKN